MKTSDFSFNLPEELIAQEPPEKRGTSRLMHLNKKTGEIINSKLSEIISFIPQNAILVLNNTRVRKARIIGHSLNTGGKVEFLFLSEQEPGIWKVLTSKSKKQKKGKKYQLPGKIHAEIHGESEDGLKLLKINSKINDMFFEEYGHTPLPPYIKRSDTNEDAERYQTVYSREIGSAAAPTAGLHFTKDILEKIVNKGIIIKYITLHVGLGTFLPIRTENIEDFKIHTESYNISVKCAAVLEKAIKMKTPIISVGTTVARTLESAYENGIIKTGWNKTNIFIYPGYKFKVLTGLLTNFHTPYSTLLLLVSAFAGKKTILNAYNEAVKNKYRFFSYGDAMLIQ